MTQQTLGTTTTTTPTARDRAAMQEGFVEVPARCFKIQTAPMSVESAVAASNAAGRIEVVIAVPLHAYLSGAGRPAVLNRYLARTVVDSPVTPEITHRLLAIEPQADGVGEAYVEVSYDVDMLFAALVA